MPKPTPAIARAHCDKDRGVEIVATPKNTVSFQRGLGDSGKCYQIVKADCPACSLDRMLRDWHVNPVDRDTVKYFCLNPSCLHYHNGAYDFVGMHTPAAQEPAITE